MMYNLKIIKESYFIVQFCSFEQQLNLFKFKHKTVNSVAHQHCQVRNQNNSLLALEVHVRELFLILSA